jgi:hypothetical protein
MHQWWPSRGSWSSRPPRPPCCSSSASPYGGHRCIWSLAAGAAAAAVQQRPAATGPPFPPRDLWRAACAAWATADPAVARRLVGMARHQCHRWRSRPHRSPWHRCRSGLAPLAHRCQPAPRWHPHGRLRSRLARPRQPRGRPCLPPQPCRSHRHKHRGQAPTECPRAACRPACRRSSPPPHSAAQRLDGVLARREPPRPPCRSPAVAPVAARGPAAAYGTSPATGGPSTEPAAVEAAAWEPVLWARAVAGEGVHRRRSGAVT